MEKKTWISIATIWLALSLMTVGTYAYFADTESSTANTMTAGVLNLNVNGIDPFSGAVVQVLDLKPGYSKYSGTVNLTINDNPGKIFKRISNVQCSGSLDTVTWFDLNVNGIQLIPDETKKLSEVEGKWIYLGAFQPNVTIPVVQSFKLELCLPGWSNLERCTFDEEFSVGQVNDPYIPPECYNPYTTDHICPGAVGFEGVKQ